MTNQYSGVDTIVFFNDATADGNSEVFSFLFPMKRACLKFWGVWGGATIEFQTGVLPLNSGSVDYFVPIMFITGQDTFTGDGQATLENVVYGDFIRCVITNASGATSINVTAQAI